VPEAFHCRPAPHGVEIEITFGREDDASECEEQFECVSLVDGREAVGTGFSKHVFGERCGSSSPKVLTFTRMSHGGAVACRMPTNLGDLNDIARRMLRHYGEHTVALMETRARNHRRRGEDEGATLWQQVANAVKKIAEG
jgi:hypothetical protein